MHELCGLLDRGNREIFEFGWYRSVPTRIIWFAMDTNGDFQYIDGSTRWSSNFFWERMFVKWKFGCSDDLYYHTPFEPINKDNVIKITNPIYELISDKVMTFNCGSYRDGEIKFYGKFVKEIPQNFYMFQYHFKPITWVAKLGKEDEERFRRNSLPFEYRSSDWFNHLDRVYQKSSRQIQELLHIR